MAKAWSFQGPLNGFFLNIVNVPRDVPFQIPHCWVYHVFPFPRNSQNMTLLWPKHGPSNLFFLNHNQCAQGGSRPNFTTLGVYYSPLSLEKAKIWPFYGQNM